MSRGGTDLPGEATLRLHHQFVSAFETLRKQFEHREMNDDALRDVAAHSGLCFEDLRVARHLRNGIAHDEPVNEATLRKYLSVLSPGASTSAGNSPGTSSEIPAVRTETLAGTKALRIHAWRDARLEQQMLANGYVAMGGDELADLREIDGEEAIRAELRRSMPERTKGAIGIFVGYWRLFLQAVPGDLIVLPTQDKAIAIGELVGPYFYVTSAEPQARHRREVAWECIGLSRSSLDPDLLKVISGRHTIQEFKSPTALERLRSLCLDSSPVGRL